MINIQIFLYTYHTRSNMKNFKSETKEKKENSITLLSNTTKRNAIVLASLIGTAGMAQAACPADTGGQFLNNTGTTCTAAQTTYSGSVRSYDNALILATGANSVTNITGADVRVTNNGYAALGVQGGAVINASGNVTAIATGFIGRTLSLYDGSIIINGNLDSTRSYASQGATLELFSANSILKVGGTTHLHANTTDGLRNSGNATFGGDVIIDANNYPQGIINIGTIMANGNMNINATNMSVGGLINQFGLITIKKDLTIINDTTAAVNTSGISISGGKVSVEGNTKVDVTGTTTNNMSNAYAAGIRVTGVNSIFESLGTNNTITTTGMNAHGLYITNGTIALGTLGSAANGITVLLESGNIKTSGEGAYGIYALPPTSGDVTIDVSSTASVETTGNGSVGVIGGNDGAGNVSITTAGKVDAKFIGVYAYFNETTSTGNIKVTETGGSIKGGMTGLYTYTYGSGDTTVISNADVTGGNAGIASYSYGTGNMDVTTSGTVIGGVTGLITYLERGKGINIGISGTVTGGTGYGIFTDVLAETPITINLDNGANVSATSGIGILDGGSLSSNMGKTTLTMNSGSKVSGKVILGNNSDSMIINGTSDISEVVLLDGGNRDGIGEWMYNTPIDLLGSTTYTNKLTFNGTTQSIAGSTMVDWQTVTLDKSNVTFINDAALVTGVGTNSDGSLQGLVLTNASTLTSPIALAVTGDVNIDSTSTLSHALGGSITGNVTNAGMINWQNLGQQLIISGNYIGNAGNMSLGTDLGDDNSVTDSLLVNGNTSGTTTVTVRPEGTSAGAQTTEGIKVIDIAGISGATFTLASPVQAGAYEYSLFKNGVSTPTDGDWYLRSTLIPTPTEPTTPIYRPGTSNYVSAQTANAEQGFLALGTLHERMNEQQVVSTDKQTWARIYGNTESNNGDSRFNYNQHVRAAQVGQDLYNKTTDNGTNVHSGIMFDYSNSEVDFADRAREDALLDNTTGNLEARSYGLGGYYTAINGDESYLDVVGMVSKLDNKFEDSYGMKSTQDGYRLGLSVEAGKKLAELGKWKVEGQGQLAYQYTNYDNFNDDISGIDAYGASTLRGRLGVRVYRHLESTKNIQQIDNAQVYGVANVIQDFINPTDVTIGGTNVSEKFDKTTLEVGGGFQVPVTGTTYVYTDARYDRSIKGNKEQGKLTIGFKTQF